MAGPIRDSEKKMGGKIQNNEQNHFCTYMVSNKYLHRVCQRFTRRTFVKNVYKCKYKMLGCQTSKQACTVSCNDNHVSGMKVIYVEHKKRFKKS
jgi:hypothetical protein